MSVKNAITGDAFHPTKKNVFVTELESGPTITRSGLIILDDNMTERGIKARWGRVWAVGPEVDDLAVGDWILTMHGRWTLGIDLVIAGQAERVWRVEYPESVLLAADTDPRNSITHRF